MKNNISRVLLILVAVMWGFGYVATDLTLLSVNPYQLLTWRFLLTFLALAGLFFPHLKKINPSSLKKGMLLGFFLYGAFALQTVGILYTTPSKNAFLTATSVVLVPILSFILYKQQIDPKIQIGIVMTFFGVALMSLNGFEGINFGDFLSLLCAIFFALQTILLGKYLEDHDPIQLMIVQMGTAAIIGLFVDIARGDVYLGGHLEANIGILYLALFNTLLCYGIQTYAQQFISATETTLILSMESFWGMLFSAWILSEPITMRTLTGAVMILAGILAAEGVLDWRKLAVFSKEKQVSETKT